nr:hypothetical protein [Rhodococcus sp. (in: high G+C Gram-positive bacteria)]
MAEQDPSREPAPTVVDRDLSKWFTLVVSIAAVIAASIVGINTNSKANETAIATARINAESFDQNQTRSFLRVQRQDTYSRFDTAAKKMFFTQKDLLDTFRQKRGRATVDAAYAAAHDALVDYYAIVPQVEMLASPEMLDYTQSMDPSLRQFVSLVDDTVASLELNADQDVDELLTRILRERYPDSTINPFADEPGYSSDQFLSIARKDLGNTEGF